MKTKISSYLGFAIKSNSIIYGLDNLKVYNKKLYLILLCHTANDSTIQFAISKSKLLPSCCVGITNDTLNDLLNADNCKIIGIKNKSLATAIISCEDKIKMIEVE